MGLPDPEPRVGWEPGGRWTGYSFAGWRMRRNGASRNG